MKFIIGIPEVHINWAVIEADNLDAALADASETKRDNLDTIDEPVYSHNLELEDYKVRLPNGDEVSSEDGIDLESSGERVGE